MDAGPSAPASAPYGGESAAVMERPKMFILAILRFEKPGADRHVWGIKRGAGAQPPPNTMDSRPLRRRCRNGGDVRLRAQSRKAARSHAMFTQNPCAALARAKLTCGDRS